jgi:mannosyltransferase
LALGLTVLLLAYTYDGLNIVTKYFDYGISLQSNAFELPSSMEETIIQDLTFSPRVFPDYRDRTQIGIENATLFMLVRNYELQEALESMRQIEDRFNKRYRYPWTFLNDDDFTDEVGTVSTQA